MITASQSFIDAIQNSGREITVSLLLNDTDTITQEDLTNNITIHQSGASNNTISIGEFCKTSCVLTAYKKNNIDWNGSYFAISLRVAGADDVINLGKFWVNNVVDIEGTNTVKVEAYNLPNFFSELANPSSEVVSAILNEIEIASGMTINGKENITLENITGVQENDTWQNLLGYIVGYDGYNIKVRGGNLYLYKYTDTQFAVDEDIIFENGLLTKREVTVNNYHVLGENGIILDVGEGWGIDYSNPYITSITDITDYLNLSYTPLKVEFLGNPLIEIGDIIHITKDNTTYDCLVMDHELIFDGGLKSVINCYADEDRKEIVPIAPIDRKIKVLKEDVNKISNHFYVDDDGVHITEYAGDSETGNNVLITGQGLEIRKDDTAVAKFSNEVVIGDENSGSIIIKDIGTEIYDKNHTRIANISSSVDTLFRKETLFRLSYEYYYPSDSHIVEPFILPLPRFDRNINNINIRVKRIIRGTSISVDVSEIFSNTAESTEMSVIWNKPSGGSEGYHFSYNVEDNTLEYYIEEGQDIIDGQGNVIGIKLYPPSTSSPISSVPILDFDVYEFRKNPAYDFGLNNNIQQPFGKALGNNLICAKENQVVIGGYNQEDKNAILIVGAGSENIGRKNTFRILPSGDVHIADSLYFDDFVFNNGEWIIKEMINIFKYEAKEIIIGGDGGSYKKGHKGITVINSGYDESLNIGNESIFIAVPNANNNNLTRYKAYHEGNLVEATTSKNGLMSADDKQAIEGFAYNKSDKNLDHWYTAEYYGVWYVVMGAALWEGTKPCNNQGILIVKKQAGNIIRQVFHDNTGPIYIRHWNGSVWSAWSKDTLSNTVSSTYANASNNNLVSVSGVYCAGVITSSQKGLRFTLPYNVVGGNPNIKNLSVVVRTSQGGYPFVRSGTDGSTYTQLGSNPTTLLSDEVIQIPDAIENIWVSIRERVGIIISVQFNYAICSNSNTGTAVINNQPVVVDCTADIELN